MTYVERLVQVEEEIFIIHREHAVSLMQLANQWEQIDSLTLIVEELRKVVANLSPMTPAPGPQDALSFPTQPPSCQVGHPPHLLWLPPQSWKRLGLLPPPHGCPHWHLPHLLMHPPPVTSAILETCWDLVLASRMLTISITPPVDSPDMETQLEGDGTMHVD